MIKKLQYSGRGQCSSELTFGSLRELQLGDIVNMWQLLLGGQELDSGMSQDYI